MISHHIINQPATQTTPSNNPSQTPAIQTRIPYANPTKSIHALVFTPILTNPLHPVQYLCQSQNAPCRSSPKPLFPYECEYHANAGTRLGSGMGESRGGNSEGKMYWKGTTYMGRWGDLERISRVRSRRPPGCWHRSKDLRVNQNRKMSIDLFDCLFDHEDR